LSDQLLARGFDPSRAGTAPATSIRIDLTPAVDELRRGLSKSNRRRTRGWAQRGLTVRLGGLADLPAVADLVAGTAAHQELEPVGLEYLTALYEELAPGGQVQVFLAEVDGAPVAVELCTGCGGVLKSRLTGMARGGPAAKSGVPAALVWNAMVWAKANGYHAFDFGGIDAELVHRIPAGPLDRLPGPAAFQASFGGQPFRYPPPVELLSSPLQRVGYDLARCSSAGDGLVASVRRAIRGGTGE
ncbi:MAG TPA: GNAT family N-acetyltransferase, partial [Pseudonocardiaceae bacterium]|nr:GNAT family N-acetyltransferase [Pseudonocardiaceae bacterium]